MRDMVLGFIAGVVLVHQLPALPDRWAFLSAGLLGVVAVLARRDRYSLALGGTLIGLAYAGTMAETALGHRLPARLEGVDLQVLGRVVGLPRHDGYRSVFLFEPDAFPGQSFDRPPRRLRLSWYEPPLNVEPGQRWRFTVRLKQPRGLMNPGAFDYERWLFSQGVDAVGYVRGEPALRGPAQGIDAVRARGSAGIGALLEGRPGAAIVRALAVADRRAMSPELWRLLNDTGTGHLLAISGLHIGLAAGAGGLAVAFLWRRSAWLCRQLPPRLAGLSAGLALASSYALLAGLGLPTRRALLMTAVAAAAWALRRDWRSADVLLWAMAVVLLVQPLAPLSAGLWLSFWAVAVILLAASHRRRGGPAWLRIQVAVSLGLFPLLALWFGQLPLISPLANALAVPLVSFLVVPMVLAGLVLLPISAEVANGPLELAAMLAEWLLQGLAVLDAHAPVYGLPALPAWVLTVGCVGMVLACVPGRWPGRVLALTLIVPVLVYRPEALDHGQARLTVADVGQGTGVVVETRRHALVYDTGPRMGRTDAAEAALLPVLKAAGVDRIDLLMVSHTDADHAGGVGTLLQSPVPVAHVVAGEALVGGRQDGWCRRGDAWQWDGVRFRVLHPASPAAGNDASCVLKVTNANGVSALIPGDISAKVEARLIQRFGPALASELLVVPHHGSASSSSAAFVRQVGAREAVFTTGYRNRYGLPDETVVNRYLLSGAAVRRSDHAGALRYRLGEQLELISQHRRDAGRYFHGR